MTKSPDDLIADRIAEQHNHLRNLIQVFIAWYTFFWTLNVAALAWIVAKELPAMIVATTPKPDTQGQYWVAILFVIMNAMGAVTSILMCLAVESMSRDIRRASELLMDLVHVRAEHRRLNIITRHPLPRWLMIYSWLGCATTLSIVGVIWFWLSQKVR